MIVEFEDEEVDSIVTTLINDIDYWLYESKCPLEYVSQIINSLKILNKLLNPDNKAFIIQAYYDLKIIAAENKDVELETIDFSYRYHLQLNVDKKEDGNIMETICGKYNNAICYADIIEDTASEQIKALCDAKVFKDSKIRIMPDVHAGKGCTIGTTMTITDKVVPSLVGVDIGCGILGVKIKDFTAKEFRENEKLRNYIVSRIESIPSGTSVHSDYDIDNIHCTFINHLKCKNNLINIERLYKSCGTLGGGNHYIELAESDLEGDLWLLVHTGSRNIGKQVAEYYQNKAIKNQEERFRKEIDFTIRKYKRDGKEGLLNEVLKQLKKKQAENKLPDDLCYLYGDDMEDYLHDVSICQLIARRNRKEICNYILEENIFTDGFDYIETIHNYISDDDERILRKGAVSAKKKEKFLIPMNMKDGTLVCVGKGNPDWNYSAPHGAGRLMGRGEAMRTLSMEEYKLKMTGIFSNTVDESTLDESPMAYKPMDSIISNIKDTAYIVDTLQPVYNFKHSEAKAKGKGKL